jgi:hypothetical protein
MLAPNYDPEKIHGLGLFKIGASEESTIGTLVQTQHYHLDSISTQTQDADFSYKHILATDKFILKVKPPSSTLNDVEEPDHSNWANNIKVFRIFKYSVDSLILQNIYVTFYNNKLVDLTCEWSVELHNALESKFGKPDEEVRDLQQTPIYYSVSWFNKDLVARYSTILKYAQVEVKGGDRFLYGCSDRAFKAQNVIDKAQNKKKLKNL